MIQMQMVAQGYLAFTLTGSATALGVVGLAQGLPQLLFSPIAGVIADRYPKRTLLLIVQRILAVSSLTIGILIGLGLIQYWHLVATGFIQGLCFAINMPTRQSWIPSLVKREDLANAIALNNAGLNASRIIGPSIAGVLIAVPFVGVNGIYYLRVVAFGWVLWSLIQIPILGKAIEARAGRETSSSELTAGMRYVVRHETLDAALHAGDGDAAARASYQTLLPAIALDTLNVGSAGLGLMMTAVGDRRADRLALDGLLQRQRAEGADPGDRRHDPRHRPGRLRAFRPGSTSPRWCSSLVVVGISMTSTRRSTRR